MSVAIGLAAVTAFAGDHPVVTRLRAEAEAVRPLVRTELARAFLAATESLGPAPARVIFRDEATREYFSPAQVSAMPDERRDELQRIELEAESYYYTKYGSPLAFACVIDLLAAHGLGTLDERRLLDFGYGSIGQLRLMASLGAEAVGVDVDTFLTALYAEPEDRGSLAKGSVRLVHGQWPADEEVCGRVGTGFDAIVSKNTLKRGYIHPEREVDPRMLVHLGVNDETFVRAVHDALVPGGLFLIYNLSPAPSGPDEPYKPWSDGRCPFERELLEANGFTVIEYDANGDDVARAVGRALGWDRGEQGMDLERGLFARYTLVRRASEPTEP
jgi:SAM-dependent methyltransferase